jgi:hypothetical protein
MLNDLLWRDRAGFSPDFPILRFLCKKRHPKCFSYEKEPCATSFIVSQPTRIYLTCVKGKVTRSWRECQRCSGFSVKRLEIAVELGIL